MTDSSKRIDSDGNTLFQIGLESLIPDDGKVYGLKRGTKGLISVVPVEIKQSADDDTDSDTDTDTDLDTDTDTDTDTDSDSDSDSDTDTDKQ